VRFMPICWSRSARAGAHRGLMGPYGVITSPNAASIALHEAMGFVKVGVLFETGDKFGKFWDTLWMEKRF
jgi:L-amino acid N-acyltransferase YncA